PPQGPAPGAGLRAAGQRKRLSRLARRLRLGPGAGTAGPAPGAGDRAPRAALPSGPPGAPAADPGPGPAAGAQGRPADPGGGFQHRALELRHARPGPAAAAAAPLDPSA